LPSALDFYIEAPLFGEPLFTDQKFPCFALIPSLFGDEHHFPQFNSFHQFFLPFVSFHHVSLTPTNSFLSLRLTTTKMERRLKWEEKKRSEREKKRSEEL